MTSPTPRASESGILRRGFFTSPAVKVMLFQASEEKSEPTWATQKAMNRPKTPAEAMAAGRPEISGLIVTAFARRPEVAEVGRDRSALRPMKSPMMMSAMSDSVLAEVKTFWMSLPI